jgi:hypothetical protein
VNVTLDNLREYIELVYKVTLETGITKSVESFREGERPQDRCDPIRRADVSVPDHQVSRASSRSRNCASFLPKKWVCCLVTLTRIGLARVSAKDTRHGVPGSSNSSSHVKTAVESAIKADHGYHSDSKQVRFLIDLMTGYTKQERRTFLRL